jgi:hypothetical protein
MRSPGIQAGKHRRCDGSSTRILSAAIEETSMNITGEPMQLKLAEAVHLAEGMMAEYRMSQEIVESLPPERQQRERQRLAVDRQHIEILAGLLRDLAGATLESVRDRDVRGEAVQDKLQEILRLLKGMLAEFTMRLRMLDGLPPECQEDESRRLARDLQLIGAIGNIVDSIADAIIQGDGEDVE